MKTWIRCFFPLDAPEKRLICFPHAGGPAGSYRSMAEALKGSGIEVLAVQYPGRQDRYGEPPARRVEDVVDAVLEELLPRLADGRPFGLFGHSMGSLLAFETARRLEEQSLVPAALFASARQGPSWKEPAARAALMHEASDEALVEEMRKLGGSEDALLDHPELMQLALPVMRADFRLLSTYLYRPGTPLACPVATLVGDTDPRVPVADMRGWESETRGRCRSHVLPGGHFYIDDQLSEVCAIVRTGLGG
ncbi:thioesterase II family protein [Streptomyces sp. NPDC059352]|uniref:thioesterase II family protein n=1 Tax=Streptomyces sp. NPDC059352 TaxID=3346810 RepID=UPI0036982DE4